MNTTLPAHAPQAGTDGGDWRARARCRGSDTEKFFGIDRTSIDAAKFVCRHCPVLEPCRSWALEHSDDFGVFGGLSGQERRQIRLGTPGRRGARERQQPGARTLTAAQIDAIRRDPRSSYAVSGDYGVSATTVQQIRRHQVGAAA
jgi:WhiB family transcriptional regulator, redox-sensing transcriptional regulator